MVPPSWQRWQKCIARTQRTWTKISKSGISTAATFRFEMLLWLGRLCSILINASHFFQILRSSWSYPVPWSLWQDFFNTSRTEEVLGKAKDSTWVHYWNHMSLRNNINMSKDHPLYHIMEKNCPQTVEHELKRNLGKAYWSNPGPLLYSVNSMLLDVELRLSEMCYVKKIYSTLYKYNFYLRQYDKILKGSG